MDKHQVQVHYGSVAIHKSQGQVEQKQRDISTALRRILMSEQERWFDVFPEVILGLNSTCSEISGISTFEAFSSRQPRIQLTFKLPGNAIVRESEDSLM